MRAVRTRLIFEAAFPARMYARLNTRQEMLSCLVRSRIASKHLSRQQTICSTQLRINPEVHFHRFFPGSWTSPTATTLQRPCNVSRIMPGSAGSSAHFRVQRNRANAQNHQVVDGMSSDGNAKAFHGSRGSGMVFCSSRSDDWAPSPWNRNIDAPVHRNYSEL